MLVGPSPHSSSLLSFSPTYRDADREPFFLTSRAPWLDGNDFSDPEIEDSGETETTNGDDYDNYHHDDSQQMHQVEVYEEANEADIEGEEERDAEEVMEEVMEEVEQQQGHEGEEEEAQVVSPGGDMHEEEEEEEEEEGDGTTGSEPVAVDTEGEPAGGQEPQSNSNASAEDITAPVAALGQQETDASEYGPPPNQLSLLRSQDSDLSGVLDAVLLLLVWVLGL